MGERVRRAGKKGERRESRRRRRRRGGLKEREGGMGEWYTFKV